MVWAFTMWSSNRAWMSSIDESMQSPYIERKKVDWNRWTLTARMSNNEVIRWRKLRWSVWKRKCVKDLNEKQLWSEYWKENSHENWSFNRMNSSSFIRPIILILLPAETPFWLSCRYLKVLDNRHKKHQADLSHPVTLPRQRQGVPTYGQLSELKIHLYLITFIWIRLDPHKSIAVSVQNTFIVVKQTAAIWIHSQKPSMTLVHETRCLQQ